MVGPRPEARPEHARGEEAGVLLQLLGRAPARSAPSRSWLSREMVSIEMPFGHAWEHSPMFVQPPKPSRSCCATMLTTRSLRSGWPWGSRPRWVTFAAVNSIDDAFGQAATQA